MDDTTKNTDSGITEVEDAAVYKVEEENTSNQITKCAAELACSVFFIGLSLFMGYTAYTSVYVVNARRSGIPTMGFPKVLLWLILIFSSIQFVRAVLKLRVALPKARKAGDRIELIPAKSVIMFLLIVGFAALWSVAGFTVSTFVAFIVVSKFLKPDVKFCRLFPISLIFTAIFYIFFSVLFRIAFYDPLMDAVIAFFRS